MTPQTVMHVYRGVVLECQSCYRVCRYHEAAVRRNCPDCGLPIAHWQELEQVTQHGQRVPPETGVSAAGDEQPCGAQH